MALMHDLLRFRERFATDSHHRDEILGGELVVSPLPSLRTGTGYSRI